MYGAPRADRKPGERYQNDLVTSSRPKQNAILEWPEIITNVHGQAKIEEPTLFLR
jgi:hypothetical protein